MKSGDVLCGGCCKGEFFRAFFLCEVDVFFAGEDINQEGIHVL
jgi:hypothetical protein